MAVVITQLGELQHKVVDPASGTVQVYLSTFHWTDMIIFKR